MSINVGMVNQRDEPMTTIGGKGATGIFPSTSMSTSAPVEGTTFPSHSIATRYVIV